MKGDIKKWQLTLQRDKIWDTPHHRKIQKSEAAVILKWLIDLDLAKYEILEIGCGNGYVAKIIIDEFQRNNIEFTYQLTDLLPECIDRAKEELATIKHGNNISFSTLDAYALDKSYPENSQSIVISTGFASAASYKDVVPLVSKILKPDGILICDFVNHFSPVIFLSKFHLLLKYFAKSKLSKHYHFGKLGIQKYFGANNLNLKKTKTVSVVRNPLICMFNKSVPGNTFLPAKVPLTGL